MRASKAMQHRVFNTPNLEIMFNHETKSINGEPGPVGVESVTAFNNKKKLHNFDQNSFVELPADDNGEIKKFQGLPKNCSLFKKETDLGKALIDRLLPQAENWVNTKNSISDSLKKLLERWTRKTYQIKPEFKDL